MPRKSKYPKELVEEALKWLEDNKSSYYETEVKFGIPDGYLKKLKYKYGIGKEAARPVVKLRKAPRFVDIQPHAAPEQVTVIRCSPSQLKTVLGGLE